MKNLFLNDLANFQNILVHKQNKTSNSSILNPIDSTHPNNHDLLEFMYTPQKHITKYQQKK